MSVMRNALLAASTNRWMRERAVRYSFVRRTVSRFMPGEDLEDALGGALKLKQTGIATVFTQLGENITETHEARKVSDHYLHVLKRIGDTGISAEVSVKLTQLGLDLSPELCFENTARILEQVAPARLMWIDIEYSHYVDRTLEMYRRLLKFRPNAGLCLQAYLYRTEKDLAALLPLKPNIRLVKGAYQEPPDIAFPKKKDVDENYYKLAGTLLGPEARARGVRAAIATHDTHLIRRISAYAAAQGIPRDQTEFQMLYGIQRDEQLRLAADGYRMIVLIAYGSYWYPWFMRRLAERPANVWFLVKNIV
jgi:proline dehydrogenase